MRGTPIGPWRLLDEIGHGGMGTVYLAERADGEFKQRAALKLLRPAIATDVALLWTSSPTNVVCSMSPVSHA